MPRAGEHREGDQRVAPREGVLRGVHTYDGVSGKMGAFPLARSATRGWWIGFGVSFLLLMLFLYTIAYLFSKGVGIWGINVPVAWGFAIINFVWWIGIGHAGTFISAILLLLHQQWRTSINRFAEAMTLFAVACAGLYPLLHLGRPWLFYYMLPYPNTMQLWPQFRSALIWDIFAVLTYFTISLVFWYVGLIPDLATLRDRAAGGLKRNIFGFFALGWRGSAKHWHRYDKVYRLLAAIATPLVLSVHSIVSSDFAETIVPGWHSTVFPPFFVAGAIYSGFAMVITLAIPLRAFFRLHDFITMRHLENSAKLLLVTGWIVTFGYMSEIFIAWYSQNEYEQYVFWNRMTGPYAPLFWGMIFCNVVSVQFLWFRRIRTNIVLLFLLSLIINAGMWLERFVIVITSLHRDYLPSAWGMYYPTIWDWATFIGTMGLFLTLFFLFVRFLPVIAISEVKELVHHRGESGPETGNGTEPGRGGSSNHG